MEHVFSHGIGWENIDIRYWYKILLW